MSWNRYQAAIRTGLFGAGCILFAYVFIRLRPAEVLSLLLRIGWRFGFVAAVYCGFELVRTAALAQCIATNEHPPYLELLKIRLYGEAVQFLTFTGPFLAEPGKAWLLRARGLSTPHAFAAGISEFLGYTFASAGMSVAGLVYLLYVFKLSLFVSIAARTVLYATSAFLLVSACALIGRIYLIGAILQGIAKLPLIGRGFLLDPAEVHKMEDLVFAVLRDRPGRVLGIVALELAAQTLLVFELFLILGAIGSSFSPVDPPLIESVTKFISVGFFFIPMQFGVTEGAYALIFQAIGIAAPAGVAVALARRLINLLAAGAGLAWAFLSRNRGV